MKPQNTKNKKILYFYIQYTVFFFKSDLATLPLVINFNTILKDVNFVLPSL